MKTRTNFLWPSPLCTVSPQLCRRSVSQPCAIFIRRPCFFSELHISGITHLCWFVGKIRQDRKRSNVQSSHSDLFVSFSLSFYWLLLRSFQGCSTCWFSILRTGNSPPLNVLNIFIQTRFVQRCLCYAFHEGCFCLSSNSHLTPLAYTPLPLTFDLVLFPSLSPYWPATDMISQSIWFKKHMIQHMMHFHLACLFLCSWLGICPC